MKILKFGGSSVGNYERISGVISILSDYHRRNEKFAVVFSAFQGVTDKLIGAAKSASEGTDPDGIKLMEIKNIHYDVIDGLLPEKDREEINEYCVSTFSELHNILHGVSLVKELTPRMLDYIQSFGERLSCRIISYAMDKCCVPCEFLDSREIIITDNNFGCAKVDFAVTNARVQKYFREHNKLQVVTGFIGSTPNGETTTMGRGGSDYTASILGAALDVSEIEIWTDVNGIMTADPRKVVDAFSLKAVTYQEAVELSHFGAKVLHPPTMQPALAKKIKIRIRNTFYPSFKGTVILERDPAVHFNLKGISSIDDVAIVRIEGSAMMGIEDSTARVFEALSEAKIKVFLITQGSSGYNLLVAVLPEQADKAKEVIENEFRLERYEGLISEVTVRYELSIVAVIGEDLANTAGIAGRVFGALGKNGINIAAMSQGSSTLNVTNVIEKRQLKKALNALHGMLFLAEQRVLNLFLIGPGLVGSALLDMLNKKSAALYRDKRIKLKLAGLANSRKMVFSDKGIDLADWRGALDNSMEVSNIEKYIETMKGMNLSNSVFIDATSGNLIIPFYRDIFESSISVVTPNKIANTASYREYRALQESAEAHSVQFRYSTNVGAGLPMISTVRDMNECDNRVYRIEAVLSGTLSYIFNEFRDTDKKFSQIISEAKENGFTEPDPRDDLNGLDVARKMLILIREAGYPFEMEDIEVESLVPEELASLSSVNSFMEAIPDYDEKFGKMKQDAADNGKTLCYIGEFDNGKARVSLKAIDAAHPFYNLRGSENIAAIYSENYGDDPVVIKGIGAGAEVTGAGIFSDILRIANYLG